MSRIIKKNMSKLDRIIRISSGIGMLIFSQFILSTVGSVLLVVIGSIFVVTSIISYCPLYDLAGISTWKESDGFEKV